MKNIINDTAGFLNQKLCSDTIPKMFPEPRFVFGSINQRRPETKWVWVSSTTYDPRLCSIKYSIRFYLVTGDDQKSQSVIKDWWVGINRTYFDVIHIGNIQEAQDWVNRCCMSVSDRLTSLKQNLFDLIPERSREMHSLPYAWVCRTCGKIDFVDVKEQTAQPEHVSYRGVDIGTCKGKMIPLYTEPVRRS